MRFFNTTGPVVAADHYCIPPLQRVNLEEVLALIRDKRYFVLHAPRQTGKTSALLALRDLLNERIRGRLPLRVRERGVRPDCAGERGAGVCVPSWERLGTRARRTLGDESLASLWPGILTTFGPDGALQEVLVRWAEADPTPAVLLIDEIDTLVGDTLIAVLRQLRGGYDERPDGFPQSVILCGVRDVRDYRIHSSAENTVITGGSAFNVKAASLRIGDFPETDVRHAARPAHRRDRTAVRRSGAASGMRADRRPAVAGQYSGSGGMLRRRSRP